MLFRIQKKKHLKVLFLLYHIVIVEGTIIFFFSIDQHRNMIILVIFFCNKNIQAKITDQLDQFLLSLWRHLEESVTWNILDNYIIMHLEFCYVGAQ